MLAHSSTWSGLFVLAAVLALSPLPAAVLWARRRPLYALGVAAWAGWMGWWSTQSWAGAALGVAVADVGVLMGVAAVRRWRFGWCVAAAAAAAYGLTAAVVLADWDTVRQGFTLLVNDMIALLKEGAPGYSEERAAAFTEALRWQDEHFAYVALGMLFGPVVLWVTAMAVLFARWLRWAGTAAQLGGSFRSMRTPDWVVWLAIGAALLWFVDRRWPNDAVRMIAWNGALGLGTVYWLNGLSIAVYAMGSFQLSPIACCAIILVLFLFQASHAVCVVGLFDTWWDFRQRLAMAAEARRLRKETKDNDNP